MGIFKSVAWAQLYTHALTSNSTWENTVCASCQAVFLFWGKCKRKLPSPTPRLLSPFAWLKHSHVEFHPKNRQILLLSVLCFFLLSFLYIHQKNLPAWWHTRFIFKIFWQHQYSAIKHGKGSFPLWLSSSSLSGFFTILPEKNRLKERNECLSLKKIAHKFVLGQNWKMDPWLTTACAIQRLRIVMSDVWTHFTAAAVNNCNTEQK